MNIGETLAEARGQAGLTVAEVSQRTRIRQVIIRAIEAGDYSTCGGDFYARGHIRSIARVVGIDPGPLISEYDSAYRAPGALSAVSMEELADATQTAELPTVGSAAAAAGRAMGARMTGVARRARDSAAAAATGPAARHAARGASAAASATRAMGAELGAGARRAVQAGRELRASRMTGSGPGLRAARFGGLRFGGLRPGGLRPGGLRFSGLRFSGLRPGGLRFSGLRFGAAGRHGPNWAVTVGMVLVVALGLGGYFLVAGGGGGPAPAAAPAARASVSPHHGTTPGAARPAPEGSASPAASPAAPRGTPAPTPPPPVPVRTLSPASVTAFGPGGTGQGDNSQLAHLATDSSAGTAWHSDWYTSAGFGNLYSGTGLLLDMGRQVTITGAQINLGASSGAQFQLRVGSSPSLRSLSPAAQRNGAGGVVKIRLLKPVHGRYVLIWFTRLPVDASGSYQAAVHDIALKGQH